jgi:catechol 2,3-dioxygenase
MNKVAFKVGHVHLKVRDLARSVEFYTSVFDMRVVEEVAGQFAFLSGSDEHHQIALQSVGANAPLPRRGEVGLYHAAFEVDSAEAFAGAYDRLVGRGIHFAPVDHGISWALYFSDPDGNGLEIYLDTRHRAQGAAEWHGVSEHLDERRIKSGIEAVNNT